MVGMERVLIVGRDAALNEALCAILEDVGYGVAVCSEPTLALALLRISFRPYVVLLVQDTSAQDWTQTLAAARSLPAHAYLVLSYQPHAVPSLWNVHTQAVVPTVPLPFEMKFLLTRVGEAVRRLRFVAAANAADRYAGVHIALRSLDVALSSHRRLERGSEPELDTVRERLSAGDDSVGL